MGSMTVPQLSYLLRERGATPVRVTDLYDLAEILLSTPSLARAVDMLSRDDIEALNAGRGTDTNLHAIGLCSETGTPFAPIDSLVAPLAAALPVMPEPIAPMDAANPTGHIIATVIAVRDLIELAAREPVKTGVSGTLLRAERVALAERLTLDVAHAAAVADLAARAGFVRPAHRMLCATETGIEARGDVSAVWSALVDVVVKAVPHSVREACARHGRLDDEFLKWQFPVADSAGAAAADSARTWFDALGLRDGGVTPLGRAFLAGDREPFAALARDTFPQLGSQVYVLDDLSIIAPGPLASDTARALDRVATSEAHGLAPRYRLTTIALHHAFAHGDSADSIIRLLEGMSLVPLSATVRSYITDAHRHGRFITVSADQAGVTVLCSTPELADTMAQDPRLDGIVRRRTTESTIVFEARQDRFESLLVDAGYHLVEPAPLPRIVGAPAADTTTAESEQLLVAGLGAGHLERALIVAMKTKTRVQITVQMPAGETTMIVEPRSVANGRVRALDIGVDAERTVPLSAITNLNSVEG